MSDKYSLPHYNERSETGVWPAEIF
jgi:hypothetical protein